MLASNCKSRHIYTTFEQIKDRTAKEQFLNQRGKVVWLTGLSGSGKTTLASHLEKRLFELNHFCQILDGDNVRSGINKNLNFSEADRMENIRRIAEVSKLFLNCGIILICAFVSPTNEMRNLAREIIGEEDFIGVFVNTPIEICEKRDPKGLYRKARTGEIKNFTGISASFDLPDTSFIEIDNTHPNIDETVEKLLKMIVPQIQLNPNKNTV